MTINNRGSGIGRPAVTAARLLSAAQFQHLGDAPPKNEWFANLGNSNNPCIVE